MLGGAVHAGLEVLLRMGQNHINVTNYDLSGNPFDLDGKIDYFFNVKQGSYQLTDARLIEDEAVKVALSDLSAATQHGIELDENEKMDMKARPGEDGSGEVGAGGADRGRAAGSAGASVAESAIVIDFGEWDAATGKFTDSPQSGTVAVATNPVHEEVLGVEGGMGLSLRTNPLYSAPIDWSTPIYTPTHTQQSLSDEVMADTRLAEIDVANAAAATGMDDYLKEELAAQVEGMVRAYARRRLRPLLEKFEVLEVEREGEWKLAQIDEPTGICHCGLEDMDHTAGRVQHEFRDNPDSTEIYFMSRPDALLLDRQTSQIYLQSYKTTGSWDRRKEAEAQIDMQGLTESVDVDNRLAQAWELIMDERDDLPSRPERKKRIADLVESRVEEWLLSLPEPPRILGVRYEYLIKGPRRQDSKDPIMPGRYVADTPLIRAYMQEGITGDDRKWAANYQTFTPEGKQKNLDYRSWRKQAVWKFMTIAQWVDKLDRGEVQPEACDKRGMPIDILAEQFIQPIHVYRNEDDLRDMLEQLEAQEVRVAQNVSRVESTQSATERRSLLNQLFPQNRRSCVYPGRCSGYEICYGSADMRANPEGSGLYQIRQVNHPQELSGSTDKVVDQ